MYGWLNNTLLAIALGGLTGGLVAQWMGYSDEAVLIWIAGVVPVLAALLVEIVRSLWQGEVGLDVVAALSMTAAVIFGEALAAAVVAVMYSGGTFLEGFAEGRARRDMRDLLSRVPRSALRHHEDGLEEVPIERIEEGDLLLIRQGDVAPVDGTVESAVAMLDQSALTGESLPVRVVGGQEVMSGVTNAGEAFDLRATRRASESTYAGIVRLVEAAQHSKAPMARMADRFSIVFLVVTVMLAVGAWWFTGDPIRAVAVLVVATTCPLILAVPVALVAGLSRAARYGVLVKGAKPLEAMARVGTLILDKTGTLTDGRPQIIRVESAGHLTEHEILYFAGALDQASKHPIAQALVLAAKGAGIDLPVPEGVIETPGEGLAGLVDARKVLVGGAGFVARLSGNLDPRDAMAGEVVVALAVDGELAGRIVLADALRAETRGFIEGLRRIGLGRIILATGDRQAVAEAITRDLGLDAIYAEQTPDQKLGLVMAEHKAGIVMMVGDGVNDAPALAAADVGVAMGARGAAASAEAADVVILVDRIAPLLPGLSIAKGARGIALECIYVGIGLSILGMVAAAFGYLNPVQGAILQEVIDVAVILNALRVLRIRPATVEAA